MEQEEKKQSRGPRPSSQLAIRAVFSRELPFASEIVNHSRLTYVIQTKFIFVFEDESNAS